MGSSFKLLSPLCRCSNPNHKPPETTPYNKEPSQKKITNREMQDKVLALRDRFATFVWYERESDQSDYVAQHLLVQSYIEKLKGVPPELVETWKVQLRNLAQKVHNSFVIHNTVKPHCTSRLFHSHNLGGRLVIYGLVSMVELKQARAH